MDHVDSKSLKLICISGCQMISLLLRHRNFNVALSLLHLFFGARDTYINAFKYCLNTPLLAAIKFYEGSNVNKFICFTQIGLIGQSGLKCLSYVCSNIKANNNSCYVFLRHNRKQTEFKLVTL